MIWSRWNLFQDIVFTTLATRCFETGIQPKTVQVYLGHASLKIKMNLYIHVLDDHKQKEKIKLESTLEEVVNSGDDFTEERFERAQVKRRHMRTRL